MPSGRFAIYVDDNRLPGALLARVSNIEIDEGDNLIGKARLRFSLAQAADGTYALIDDSPFIPGANIQITMAAPGGTDQTVFTGVLASLRPHFEDIESNCYLEVIVADHAMVMAAEDRAMSYPDASDSAIAEEILGKYGYDIQAEQTDAQLDSDDVLLMQRCDDWAFLKQLAARNGFSVFFQPDPTSGTPTCFFGKARLDETAQADLTILRGGANLDWIDFQISCDRPAARSIVSIDHVAKRIVRNDAESAASTMGDDLYVVESEQGLVQAGAGATVRHIRGAIPRDTAVNAHAAGVMAQDHMTIEARGQLSPALYRGLLRPHLPVLIKGVGDRLTGTFYVSHLTTTMKDGELSQNFTAHSNALGRTGGEDFGQSAEDEEPA